MHVYVHVSALVCACASVCVFMHASPCVCVCECDMCMCEHSMYVWCASTYVHTRDGMIHRCIAVSQYDTGIDKTFNVSIYRVS